VAPVRNPATPPYDVKDKGDAKRNRELTQGCGPGMPGPYGVAWTGGGRFAAKDVGGGVLDAPRRGQDPSLRCKR